MAQARMEETCTGCDNAIRATDRMTNSTPDAVPGQDQDPSNETIVENC